MKSIYAPFVYFHCLIILKKNKLNVYYLTKYMGAEKMT